ncbi:polysaccharide deacetylase family protein [Peribacillus frigoritolerans]|jgi:probable sporulation protein (polysaccharide deacetylase family)|uniref:polysaccharide deacetylase family protein n=1 Tax=Peribacillus TaxID=2675229 RepID=UPI0021AA23BA|nr:polysaccharide deacetylase family protein [Peribacillus frigoritolerans]MCT4476914.1 polysaccharide deacetylase family protein [Peribacillus frigoritolerans]
MNNKWKQIVAISAIAGISWLLVQNPYTQIYLTQLTDDSVASMKQEDELLLQIKESTKKYEIAPQDARIDSVWKTVPAYNGLKVNIDDSYKAMKKEGVFDKDKLVFQQVPAKIHMEDLDPAPIYRAHPEKPVVSFLINVAWGNEYLQDMLAVLKKHNVKATFFLEGNWTKKNPDLAKMIKGGGHEIGNHSYSHPDMKNISAQATREEIRKTNEVIEAVTGLKMKWFAPPSGSYRDETVKIADSFGMETVMWSVDTIDWQKPSPEVLQQRVLSKVHPGAFILMHPTESTAKSLETLIIEMKKKNLDVVTVSEAVDEERSNP